MNAYSKKQIDEGGIIGRYYFDEETNAYYLFFGIKKKPNGAFHTNVMERFNFFENEKTNLETTRKSRTQRFLKKLTRKKTSQTSQLNDNPQPIERIKNIFKDLKISDAKLITPAKGEGTWEISNTSCVFLQERLKVPSHIIDEALEDYTQGLTKEIEELSNKGENTHPTIGFSVKKQAIKASLTDNLFIKIETSNEGIILYIKRALEVLANEENKDSSKIGEQIKELLKEKEAAEKEAEEAARKEAEEAARKEAEEAARKEAEEAARKEAEEAAPENYFQIIRRLTRPLLGSGSRKKTKKKLIKSKSKRSKRNSKKKSKKQN